MSWDETSLILPWREWDTGTVVLVPALAGIATWAAMVSLNDSLSHWHILFPVDGATFYTRAHRTPCICDEIAFAVPLFCGSSQCLLALEGLWQQLPAILQCPTDGGWLMPLTGKLMALFSAYIGHFSLFAPNICWSSKFMKRLEDITVR